MEHGSALEKTANGVSLFAWRQMATNALMNASAIVYLPAAALFFVGQGPQFAWPVKAAVAAACLAVASGVLLRGADYRPRTWALLVTAYTLAVLGSIAYPKGFFVRSLPLVLPMLAMVLLGTRAGRAATVVSAAILLIVPFLESSHGYPNVLAGASTGPQTAPGLIWTQVAALMAMLIATMFLLDRFHRFLMQSLAGLKQEATDKSAAHQQLEREMVERRRLESELAKVAEAERRRLGLDIHDGVCQQITGALVRCEALARRLHRHEPLVADDLAALSSLLEEAIDDAHDVARGLCPLEPGPAALVAALGTLARRIQRTRGVACRFVTTGDVSAPDPTAAQHLYRIAQEAVSNAARHAHARAIKVALHGQQECLLLQVEDDGNGLPETPSTAGMGMRTMAYRAHLLESELNVTPAPGRGTRITCRVPRASLLPSDEGRPPTAEAIHEG